MYTNVWFAHKPSVCEIFDYEIKHLKHLLEMVSGFVFDFLSK